MNFNLAIVTLNFKILSGCILETVGCRSLNLVMTLVGDVGVQRNGVTLI